MRLVVLDTHAAIWSVNGSLHASARRVVDAAADRDELLLSPMTAWEIGMLVEKRRLKLALPVQDFVRQLFARTGTVTAALTPAIALAAATIGGAFHGDPADRIIVATALSYGAALMTRDEEIARYAKASKTLSCIGC